MTSYVFIIKDDSLITVDPSSPLLPIWPILPGGPWIPKMKNRINFINTKIKLKTCITGYKDLPEVQDFQILRMDRVHPAKKIQIINKQTFIPFLAQF